MRSLHYLSPSWTTAARAFSECSDYVLMQPIASCNRAHRTRSVSELGLTVQELNPVVRELASLDGSDFGGRGSDAGKGRRGRMEDEKKVPNVSLFLVAYFPTWVFALSRTNTNRYSCLIYLLFSHFNSRLRRRRRRPGCRCPLRMAASASSSGAAGAWPTSFAIHCVSSITVETLAGAFPSCLQDPASHFRRNCHTLIHNQRG